MMGLVHTQTRNFDQALACYAQARQADADSKFVDSLQAMTLAVAGRRVEARAMLLEDIVRRSRERTTFRP